jgi:hypothetical protein
MKKGKLLVLGLIALMLAGGLALASCEEKTNCPGGGNTGSPGVCGKDSGMIGQCTNKCITTKSIDKCDC